MQQIDRNPSAHRLLMSVLVDDEPIATRLFAARALADREGGLAHVAGALLALLAGDRYDAEMTLLRARSDRPGAADCAIEVAWAFLLVETGHPERAAAHALRARQADGFGADPANAPLVDLLDAQAQPPAADGDLARRGLVARARGAIPEGSQNGALQAYAAVVAATLAFAADDVSGAISELARGRAQAPSWAGVLGARADLLEARVAFAAGNAGDGRRLLSRAIERLAIVGARRDLGLAYLIRASSAGADTSERNAWFGRAEPLLAGTGGPADLERLRPALRSAMRALAERAGGERASGRDPRDLRERLEGVLVERCEAMRQAPCSASYGCPGSEALDAVLGIVADTEEQLIVALEHSLADRTDVGQLAAAMYEIASVDDPGELVAEIPRLALVVRPATAAELFEVERDAPPRVLSRSGEPVKTPAETVAAELRGAFSGAPTVMRAERSFAVFPLSRAPATALLVERAPPTPPLSARDLQQLAVYVSLARSLLARARATAAIPEQAAGAGAITPGEILSLAELERRACAAALVQFGGNVAYAARALGIARGTLYAKLKRYGIPIPETTPGTVTVPRRDPRSP